jgi:molybdate transport system substrate-binding protein
VSDSLSFGESAGEGEGEGEGLALRILCAGAVREALGACARAFCAQRPGARVTLRVDTSGGVLARLARGEAYDLVAAAGDAMDALARAGALAGARLPLGASRLALGVRIGERAPDVSTLEAFREALLAARSFSRGDPAGGGTGGRLIEEGLARLGLLEPTRARTLLRVGGHKVMEAVADGSADFGLTQSTEITPAPGVEIGAFLPPGLQAETVYEICALACARTSADMSADASADASSCEQANAFLAHMRAAPGRAAFAAAGFFSA